MANYNGPVCRLCRREGQKLFLKGQKCLSNCTFDRRNGVIPGMHGLARRRKVSDYGLQLRAKQRARRLYGVMETQFRHYFEKAERSQGVTGTVLLQQLERRLDNVIYRLGMAASRREARVLTTHRHYAVNGRTVNIPSYQVRPGDIISVREGSKNIKPIEDSLALVQSVPDWLTLEADKKQGTVLRYPERHEMDQFIDEQLIVEYYSR
ncbi:MAG TPA: 30S ribosomal protein S4 [Candidatus Angelobacter sp.]|jgi:small subunit ribosomal protein S4|nr:30S ribosomal protein S4 [Candidatus Angelobacter sp.]